MIGSQPPFRARAPVRSRSLPIINPASGARLAVVANTPEGPCPYPLVVLVAGGLSAGETYFGGPGIARRLAGLGYAVVHFDPDGRGKSAGVEDYNGTVHQEGLSAVIARAITDLLVDPGSVVVAGFCFGATMAAGALARHPELPIRLFLDWEGPANRDDVRAGASVLGWALPSESVADGWWREREESTFIKGVEAPYQRVEGTPNHLRLEPSGCLDLVGRAVRRAQREGRQPPWTRLNGNAPNHPWTTADPARWLPRLPAETAVLPYLVELVPPRPIS